MDRRGSPGGFLGWLARSPGSGVWAWSPARRTELLLLPSVISWMAVLSGDDRPCLPPRQDFLPADIQTQFAMSRELIRNIYNSFHKLRDRAERMVSRAIDNAADLLIFGKELRQVTLVGSVGLLLWGGALDLGGRLGGASPFTVMTLIPTRAPQRRKERAAEMGHHTQKKGKGWRVCGQSVGS